MTWLRTALAPRAAGLEGIPEASMLANVSLRSAQRGPRTVLGVSATLLTTARACGEERRVSPSPPFFLASIYQTFIMCLALGYKALPSKMWKAL